MPLQNTTNKVFDKFIEEKDRLVWSKVVKRHESSSEVWKGLLINNGIVNVLPKYFIEINRESNGTLSVSLYANVRLNPDGNGRQKIDSFSPGKVQEIDEQRLHEIIEKKYGFKKADFNKTPARPSVGFGKWEEDRQVGNEIIQKKTAFSPSDRMIALVILHKFLFSKSKEKYVTEVVVIPWDKTLKETEGKRHLKRLHMDVDSAMQDFHQTVSELKDAGFNEDVEIPDWANVNNWDFHFSIPREEAESLKNNFNNLIENLKVEEYEPEEFVVSSTNWLSRVGQTSQYYQGPIPDPDTLDQYVGTSSLDATQIKSIFGGVDEAIGLVNQFDSSLLLNVAFIYNFSGGGAYGVYMSSLDEEIKNAKLKKMLKMDGYSIQDGLNGAFYATHPEKDKQQIDREILAYRQKIDQRGATTFGIDMNKVIGAARADANESGITDPAEQRLLGILHLGATMVHEAVHSKGSHTEGPSENAEAKFMAWAMPRVNEQRKKLYESQNRISEYTPLVINPSQRRTASQSNWFEKATGISKTAQYGAQFLHNQMLVKHFGPAPWSSAFWDYGVGPIELMLDRSRPTKTQASEISLEGQLREQTKDRWGSIVDTGASSEELLEPGRDPLVAYKSVESLMEDGRTKPLMLPVTSLKRKASYDSGKDAFGYMCNLDIPMEDRVQRFDDNDEETTWFDSRFIRNQPRYNPEYGNPMSKEDGFYAWIKDLNMQVETWDSAMEERPNLKTSPWKRVAQDNSSKTLYVILSHALKNIASGSINGTRFLCNDAYIPFIKKYFENDLDIKIYVIRGDTNSKVWVVNSIVDKDLVTKAEKYICGESDDESDKAAFDGITQISRIRSESISTMIETVRQAMRDSGTQHMLILGDLPLAVATETEWDAVRSVDFCSNTPDNCVKIGEIVGNYLGAELDEYNPETGMLIARWRCVTFRFRGDYSPRNELLEMLDEDSLSTEMYDLYGRLVTPLMLALDVMTEKLIDPSGEAMPDVEVKVVRTIFPADKSIALNPLIIVDAIFLSSVFGFSIEHALAETAQKMEFDNDKTKAVWDVIKAAGKGAAVETAEKYGLDGALYKLTGGFLCQCQ